MGHTKGDWKVAQVEGKRMTCVYTDDTNIALLVHQEDARLIASAPRLFEENKELKRELQSWKDENFENVEDGTKVIDELETKNKKLQIINAELLEAFKEARKAINSLPIDSLGETCLDKAREEGKDEGYDLGASDKETELEKVKAEGEL